MQQYSTHSACIDSQEIHRWRERFVADPLIDIHIEANDWAGVPHHTATLPAKMVAQPVVEVVMRPFWNRPVAPLREFDVTVQTVDRGAGEVFEVVVRWVGGPSVEDVTAALRVLLQAAPFHVTFYAARIPSDVELEALKSAVTSAWHILPPAAQPQNSALMPIWPPEWWAGTWISGIALQTLCLFWIKLNFHPQTGELNGPPTPFISPIYVGVEHLSSPTAEERSYYMLLLAHFPQHVTRKAALRADVILRMLGRGSYSAR